MTGSRCEIAIWLVVAAGEVYPLTFTSRLTTGQFTTNPLGPNGLPAGNPVALPLVICRKAAEKSVWRRLSPAVTAGACPGRQVDIPHEHVVDDGR